MRHRLPGEAVVGAGGEQGRAVNLERLRQRNLGHKRSLALREYALGLEALERAARGEPLWRIHEPVFAVLALESEPIDPRLWRPIAGMPNSHLGEAFIRRHERAPTHLKFYDRAELG